MIERVADLGGSYGVTTKLLEGYNTYLEHPVPDLSLGLPDETKNMG